MNKPFAYFDNIDTFKKKKVSGSPSNDTYIDFNNKELLTFGIPDILFETICFIENERKIFTHGAFYNCEDQRNRWTEI